MNETKLKYKFTNFTKAFNQLKRFCEKESLNEFELQGLIQCFEYTFELAWKTMKIFLEMKQGIKIPFVRDIIKTAYQTNIIDDGGLWLEALEKRNLMSHTYDEKLALEMQCIIKTQYFAMIEKFHLYLNSNIA